MSALTTMERLNRANTMMTQITTAGVRTRARITAELLVDYFDQRAAVREIAISINLPTVLENLILNYHEQLYTIDIMQVTISIRNYNSTIFSMDVLHIWTNDLMTTLPDSGSMLFYARLALQDDEP